MNSKLLTVLAIGFAFLTGFAACYVFLVAGKAPLTPEEHWERVNEYREYLADPANLKYEPQLGLSGVEVPFDPMPHLQALVEAKWLRHVELVFPQVKQSSPVNQCWMKYCADRPEIVHAIGLHAVPGGAYTPAGTPRLHLELWYHPNAEQDVQQLIKDLDAKFGDGQEAAPVGVTSEKATADERQ